MPAFDEVLAAGTAVSLVPIRSITRRLDASNSGSLAATLGSHARLQVGKGEETIEYMPEDAEGAGPVCLRLLTQLKAIQQGKAKDPFNWVASVTEADVHKAKDESA